MAQSATALDRPHRAASRYIYAFGGGLAEGDASMRELLGGKGAGLAEMTNAGLPVPPGFTITTAACNDYFAAGERQPDGLWEDIQAAVREVERLTGKGFGDAANPLLVSVRSGAKFSMPGMMDTVLNLGLNEETLHGLIALTGNERFGWDAYRRFVQMFGRIVMGVDGERFDEALEAAKERRGSAADTDLTAADLRELAREFGGIIREDAGRDFPSDPWEQLDLAIRAVFASWFGRRARDYRAFNDIPDDLGTAVNVMTMVFGNMGEDSGTGVAFTRDPNTGERRLYGEFLTNAQGEDVVAGIRTPRSISEMRDAMPAVYDEFQRIAERLERHYRDVQDLEFTIERGRLFMLQTRSAKRTAAAAVKIAADMADERIISRTEALQRIEPGMVEQLLRNQFDQAARASAVVLARGLNASPGAAVGGAVFDADRAAEAAGRGEAVVLVRIETSPDDFHGMAVSQGVLTARGGATSHAAVVARQIGKPCVAGVGDLTIDQRTRTARLGGRTLTEGDVISLDGSTGEVFLGALPTVEVRFEEQAGPPADPRLGRHGSPAAGLDERRQARGSRAGAPVRCRGHRPVPHGAHVPRGRAPRHRPRRDPRRHAGDPREAAACRRGALDDEQQATIERFDAAMGRLERLQEGDFRGHLRRDERAARGGPADRPAAPRVPAGPRAADRAGDAPRDARHPGRRPRARPGLVPARRRSRACASRTRCSACAAAASGS